MRKRVRGHDKINPSNFILIVFALERIEQLFFICIQLYIDEFCIEKGVRFLHEEMFKLILHISSFFVKE